MKEEIKLYPKGGLKEPEQILNRESFGENAHYPNYLRLSITVDSRRGNPAIIPPCPELSASQNPEKAAEDE